jgi:hypothetical protein
MPMLKVKAGRPLIDFVMLCYQADLPPLLIGRHGLGKSELLQQAARELGVRCVVRDLSVMEPPDLVGIPRVERKVTRYFPPAFLPTGGKGVLVFEELNRCPHYMRVPCLQLLTARTLNDYTLPAGWLPAAAINPAADGYDADDLDAALASRFARAEVVPDRDEWLAWARAAGVHPGVISYVEADPTVFDDPESNPRAWTYVSHALAAAARTDAAPETLRAVVVGLVCEERGAAFLKVLAGGERPLTAEELLNYRSHVRRLRDWVAAGRLDLVGASLHALKIHLQVRGNYEQTRRDPTRWRGLAALLGDLPGDCREDFEAFLAEHGYDVPQIRKVRQR